jgi:hypothetical protein
MRRPNAGRIGTANACGRCLQPPQKSNGLVRVLLGRQTYFVNRVRINGFGLFGPKPFDDGRENAWCVFDHSGFLDWGCVGSERRGLRSFA